MEEFFCEKTENLPGAQDTRTSFVGKKNIALKIRAI